MTSDGAITDNEIVWTARAIGKVLNLSERQAYWRLEQGHIPAKKFGNTWGARKAALLRLFDSSVGARDGAAERIIHRNYTDNTSAAASFQTEVIAPAR